MFTVLILLLLYSCSNTLEISKGSDFTLSVLPYRTVIAKGETREIEITIDTENTYSGTSYAIRSLQTEGTGTVMLEDGRILQDSRSYLLTSRRIRIRYVAKSSGDHSFTLTVSDNLDHSHDLTIALTGS